MMKMILICILMTLIAIQSKAQYIDTSYQSISYEKTFYQKGRFEVYGWASYDLYWAEEIGGGIIITINNKRKHYGKNFTKPTNNWDWNRNNLWIRQNSGIQKEKENRQRFQIPSIRYPFIEILQRND